MASVTTVEYANEILRKLFLGQYHRSLLILDDVWSSEIIKSFDVCAKVLVTTQDITVLDNISKKNVNVVKMQSGFTQEESLQVLFQYLKKICQMPTNCEKGISCCHLTRLL